MHGWVIALIVLATAAIIVAIVVPIVIIFGGAEENGGLELDVLRIGGGDGFGSTNGEESAVRTFHLTLKRHGEPLAARPVLLRHTLTGTTGAIGELLGAELIPFDTDLCLLTNSDGVIDYQWQGATSALTNNIGVRAWTERFKFTAFESGSCGSQSGASVTKTMVMYPEAVNDGGIIYVESAVVEPANDRIVLKFRSLSLASQEITETGTGGVVFAPDLSFQSTGLTVAPALDGTVYATFAPGVLPDVLTYGQLPLFYTSNDFSVNYLANAANPGVKVLTIQFMATVSA